MKKILFALLFTFVLGVSFAQQENSEELNLFENTQHFDPENKVIVNINSLDPIQVIFQEKDYVVSSDRVKQLRNKEKLSQENIVYKLDFSQSITNPNWVKFLKVLINDKELLKIKEVNTNESFSYLYVTKDFDLAYYQLLASKIECPFTIITNNQK